MRLKTQSGKSLAASHSAACGASSDSTKERIEVRSSSCSGENGHSLTFPAYFQSDQSSGGCLFE